MKSSGDNSNCSRQLKVVDLTASIVSRSSTQRHMSKGVEQGVVVRLMSQSGGKSL